MKESTGVFGQRLFFVLGMGDSLIGRNAQCSRAFFQSITAGPALVVARGSGAPILIQASMSAICSGESFLSFGGIFNSASVLRRALIRRLSSGLRGTMAGPESPPARRPSFVSSRRPPLIFSALLL